MSELFEKKAKSIHILGGEPLLNPELDEISTGQSYIEQERKLLNKQKKFKKSVFHKWKISILKKFFKIILSQYPK